MPAHPLRVLILSTSLLAAAALALGRPHAASASTATDHVLEHQGRKRTYRLVLPKGHTKTKAAPLVLALHGGGGTSTQFDRSTGGQFGREADKRGWVVAFPQGVAKGWNDGRKLTGLRDRQRKGVDDVAFLGALIDHLHTTHGIDRTRVYATGISNGGFMSVRLGLDLATKIAAIAPVTAQLQQANATKVPAHPVGLLLINGTKDPLVPYAGGHVAVFGKKRGAILSTDKTLARWRGFNACAAESTSIAIKDRAPRDGTRASYTTWKGSKGADVALVRVAGGGHAWPGGTQYLPAAIVGRASQDFDAVPLIFDFFARHRRVIKAATPPKDSPATKR